MRSRKARADLVAEQAGLLLGVRAATSPRTGPLSSSRKPPC
jgi:hypothetical protein